MVSTKEKKQQNKTLFSQLNERVTDFLSGQSNQDNQTESGDTMILGGIFSCNASKLTRVNYSQVELHTFENIVKKVRSEMDIVLISVKT